MSKPSSYTNTILATDWEHVVHVEAIKEAEAGVFYPRCLKGKRCCPPENVGGMWGYNEFLRALSNENHPEHATYVEWIGGDFDPEYFDLGTINQKLSRLGSYPNAQA